MSRFVRTLEAKINVLPRGGSLAFRHRGWSNSLIKSVKHTMVPFLQTCTFVFTAVSSCLENKTHFNCVLLKTVSAANMLLSRRKQNNVFFALTRRSSVSSLPQEDFSFFRMPSYWKKNNKKRTVLTVTSFQHLQSRVLCANVWSQKKCDKM